MSTYFEFLLKDTTDLSTEEFELKLFDADLQSLDLSNNIGYLTKITFAEDTAMAIIFFSLGCLFNSIILRSYWKEKSPTSTYFIAFAAIDTASLAFMLMRRAVLFVWPNQTNSVLDAVSNLSGALYNFGPMFLAMDRCLIVAFTHNFREKEGTLRVAK